MRRVGVLLVATALAVAAFVTVRSDPKPAAPRPSADTPAPSTQLPTTTPPSPRYRGGEALGPPVHTDYGTVQVKVTVERHRISDVTAVHLPDRDAMDRRLSRPAAVRLERAVIAQQSADVDIVSGATYTSVGYLQSLQAALDKLS